MIKLICFDLDDTLIREIHSVMLLCVLHGKLAELLEIEKSENDGTLHWIEADHKKAALIAGLSLEGLREGFIVNVKPLRNIAQTVRRLKQNGVQSIVITAGPVQVAAVAGDLWGFDAYNGSDYEVADGVFTGRILEHIGDKGKVSCLNDYCRQHGILPSECVAVGDGATDIPLFEYCGNSIAVNASEAASQKAGFSIHTDNLADILAFI